jgi:ABC-type multidrug transport system ATPase subunit
MRHAKELDTAPGHSKADLRTGKTVGGCLVLSRPEPSGQRPHYDGVDRKGIGANGAGKTTVIRMLLGQVVPSSGAISLFGRPPSRETSSRLGYVPQGLGLYADLTVAENLRFVETAFGTGSRELPPALAAASDRLVGDIGLGLQRQLAFVTALGHSPALLVLDEPTSGVDPLSRARLWDVIHDQAEAGAGVLVTTHYMQEAQQCDRPVLMSHGRRVAALDGLEAARARGRTGGQKPKLGPRQIKLAQQMYDETGTDGKRR